MLAAQEANDSKDFSPLRDFYELNGVPEEDIAEAEKDFVAQATEREITQGRVLDSWAASFSTEEFESSISELNIPDDQRDALCKALMLI